MRVFKSKSSRSSRSSKLKELKRSTKLKKLMTKQALEIAQYEAEMEKKKIDIEMQNQKIAKGIRIKVQLEEKEVDLLALEDYDSESNEENSVVSKEDEPRFSLELHLPKQEQTANWVANCQQETKPLNLKAPEFILHSGSGFRRCSRQNLEEVPQTFQSLEEGFETTWKMAYYLMRRKSSFYRSL